MMCRPGFVVCFLCAPPYCAAKRGPAAQLTVLTVFPISLVMPVRPGVSSCRSPGPLDSAHKVFFVLLVVLLFVPAVVLISECNCPDVAGPDPSPSQLIGG
jgi:hypothetical protein